MMQPDVYVTIDTDAALAASEFVEFFEAGTAIKGEFHCAECGYGVTVYRALPACPMCTGSSWEQSAWSPFARAGAY
jgi:rubrerythrin